MPRSPIWPIDPGAPVEPVGTLFTDLPAQLGRWLDQLDETGRWALLKLVTGGLRIGVSARLAKTAAALEPFRELEEVSDFDVSDLRPWTDDYSDILGPFLSKMKKRGG